VKPKPEPKPTPHVSRLADRKVPARKHVVTPTYPAWAREQGIEGTVTLELTVTKEGKVSSPRVTSSCGHKRLDEEALKAIRKWTYEPAVQDGKPREVKIRERIRFRLG
jgi:protein TonB